MFRIGVNFSTVHSNSGNSREGLLCVVRGPTPSLFSDMSDLRVIVVHSVGRGRSFREHLVHPPLLFIKGNWGAERGHVICPRSCSAFGNVDGVVTMSCASSSVALAASECPPCLQERQIWAPVTTYSLRSPNWPLGGKVAAWACPGKASGSSSQGLITTLGMCLLFLSAESQPAPLCWDSQKAWPTDADLIRDLTLQQRKSGSGIRIMASASLITFYITRHSEGADLRKSWNHLKAWLMH